MNFLLKCMAALLLASNVEVARQARRQKINPKEKFEAGGILRDSCIPAPPDALQLVLNVNITVNYGNYISPSDANNITFIGYYSSPDCMYTMMMTDIDAPYPRDSYMSPWLVGMYSNIRNSDMSTADVAVAPITATPAVDSGIHRIVIMLYLQIKEIDITSECFTQYEVYRARFPLEDFMSEYGLTPVAGNYYNTSYPTPVEVCGKNCEKYCESL